MRKSLPGRTCRVRGKGRVWGGGVMGTGYDGVPLSYAYLGEYLGVYIWGQFSPHDSQDSSPPVYRREGGRRWSSPSPLNGAGSKWRAE